MALQDNNSERRNLVVTSLGFIVFCLAEGKLTENELKLQLINITFENTIALEVFAWIIILWFALRYWQINRSVMRAFIHNGTSCFSASKLIAWYVGKETGLNHREEDGFVVSNVRGWEVDYGIVTNVQRDDEGNIKSMSSSSKRVVEISGVYGFLIKLVLYPIMAITQPNFGSYVVPYVMFYVAVILTLFKFYI